LRVLQPLHICGSPTFAGGQKAEGGYRPVEGFFDGFLDMDLEFFFTPS